MNLFKNKIATIAVILLLAITAVETIQTIPNASAHTPAWQIPTYAFIHVAPNPVGVGQTLNVIM
jgi:hypothetical protein